MDYKFRIVDTTPKLLALAETRVAQSEIPVQIFGLFDRVYRWLLTTSVVQTGDNYALYDEFEDSRMRMRAGIPISAPFADSATICCFQLDPGSAAHTRHFGSYSELTIAHEKLNDWLVQQGLKHGGLSWEEYGCWDEDESKLITDVYIKLA